MVMTSVFGRKTAASDLCLTGDHFMDKLSTICQPTRPTQPSIPLGSVNEYQSCIYMDYEGGDHLNGRLGLRASIESLYLRVWPVLNVVCENAAVYR